MTQVTETLSRDGSTHVTDEVINTATHLAAGCFALLGTVLLLVTSAQEQKIWQLVGFTVYGLALLSLFTFSTLHHGLNLGDKANRLFRTFDYLSIFGLIGGTVTPIVLVLYRNAFGWSVLGVVWAIIALGITLRAVFHYLPKYVTSTLFIVLGWLPVLLVFFGGTALPAMAIVLLAAGGLLYTGGLVLFSLEWPNPWPGKFGFHELWHIIVALAALCHFMFMYLFVLPV
jgi:hemolysin III